MNQCDLTLSLILKVCFITACNFNFNFYELLFKSLKYLNTNFGCKLQLVCTRIKVQVYPAVVGGMHEKFDIPHSNKE